jgi:putative FmdB family regulatory protein
MAFKCDNYKCQACGHVLEEYVHREDPPVVCEKCGGETEMLIGGGPTNLFQQSMYPYFDRGLGVMLTSAGHRAQVCRERGLTPVDGGFSVRDDMGVAAAERRNAAEEAEFREYEAEVRATVNPDIMREIYEKTLERRRHAA